MARVHSFDGEIDKARTALADAIKGMEAAELRLAGHAQGGMRLDAVNFPIEEALVQETVGLLDRWKQAGVALLKSLDLGTETSDLQHRRLFDEKAGYEGKSLFSRKIAQPHARPASIAADLDILLEASASLEAVIKAGKPAMMQHHRGCEDLLDRVISRRQRIETEIEEVQRQADALLPRIADRQEGPGSGGDEGELANERAALTEERDSLLSDERSLQLSRDSLQRLIDIYAELVDALNRHVGGINAIAGKLSVDIEQRIALLKAVADDAVPPLPKPARSASVAALIAAFETNVLAGHDLSARKARADEIFARRLEPQLLVNASGPDESPAGAQPETRNDAE
jgi:hypothetical protein